MAYINIFKKWICFLYLNIFLFFPITVFAHLITITETSPFPNPVPAGGTATATFTITNITSQVPLNIKSCSQFPAGSGLSIFATNCGLLNPGQSCTVILQIMASTISQTISAALNICAKPSADCVRFPFTVNIGTPPMLPLITVGAAVDNAFTNYIPIAYTSTDNGSNWALTPTFPLPAGQPEGLLDGVSCVGLLCTAVGVSSQSGFTNELPLAYTSTDGGFTWTLSAPLPLAPGQPGAIFYGVSCVSNICTGVGASRLGAFGQLPVAYVSMDNGVTWTVSPALALPAGQTQGFVNAVSCSGTNCAAVGGSFNATPNSTLPLAYTSNDSGNTWTLSPPLALPPGQTQAILSGTNCAGSACVAVGYTFDNTGAQLPVAYTSSNSGATWSLSPALTLPAGQSQGELVQVNCRGSFCSAVGYSFGSGTTLPLAYTSTDGGITWTLTPPLALPAGKSQGLLFGVNCNGSICNAVGQSEDGVTLPLAYTSSDGGLTWTLASSLALPGGKTQGQIFSVGGG